MRTTVDIPDPVFRSLKVRAGLQGVTLKQLFLQYVERGLREPEQAKRGRRDDPPVAIPPSGRTIRLTPEDIHRLEEEDDEAKLG
ncbi:MAG TPA: hypothetical protein VIE13_07475 [Terriglobales bacterium]|jgi:hypothetical protein